jgi:hypothetical protein
MTLHQTKNITIQTLFFVALYPPTDHISSTRKYAMGPTKSIETNLLA